MKQKEILEGAYAGKVLLSTQKHFGKVYFALAYVVDYEEIEGVFLSEEEQFTYGEDSCDWRLGVFLPKGRWLEEGVSTWVDWEDSPFANRKDLLPWREGE